MLHAPNTGLVRTEYILVLQELGEAEEGAVAVAAVVAEVV